MDPKVLLLALDSSVPTRWRDAALAIVRTQPLTFAGNSTSRATATVHDLVQIYRFRLDRTRRRGIPAVGMEELLEALSLLPATTLIHLTPFVGPNDSVYAFWHADVLLGCITVKNGEPDQGLKELEMAMGKQD